MVVERGKEDGHSCSQRGFSSTRPVCFPAQWPKPPSLTLESYPIASYPPLFPLIWTFELRVRKRSRVVDTDIEPKELRPVADWMRVSGQAREERMRVIRRPVDHELVGRHNPWPAFRVVWPLELCFQYTVQLIAAFWRAFTSGGMAHSLSNCPALLVFDV